MANTTITPSVGAIALAGIALSESLGSMTIVPNTGQAFFNGPAPSLTNVTFTLATLSLPITDFMTRTFTWASMPNGGIASQGQPIQFGWATAFFIVTGTIGAAGSVQLEGSNDGVNWFKLSPAALTSLPGSFLLNVTERPRWIRPHVTAGDGTTSINVVGTFSLAAAA